MSGCIAATGSGRQGGSETLMGDAISMAGIPLRT